MNSVREDQAGASVVCTPNWLGDCVMAMPGLQVLRRSARDRRIVVVTKPPLAALWRMHPAVDAIVELPPGPVGVWRAARAVRGARAGVAYVLPNSIRAALVPLLAGFSERVGQRGKRPAGMLTRIVPPPREAARGHQVWEAMAIFGAVDAAVLTRPELHVPPAAVEAMAARLGGGREAVWIGVMPGAARGPSKRWPAQHFAEAVKRVLAQTNARVVLLGRGAEGPACAEVARLVGGETVDLTDRTSLAELAAVLARCAVVLCNDSGGMHLAAAVGTPVVAVYGITDPDKTGPLGAGHRIVSAPGVRRSRDLERNSAEARAVLASIAPERVAGEMLDVLKAGER